jgi:uncharacterized protein (DUF342 family)
MSDAIDRLAKVVISGDRMTASLRLEPGLPGPEVTEDALRALLTARGIGAGEDDRPELIRQAIDQYRTTGGPVEVVIARAIAPAPGEDARFELDSAFTEQQASGADDGAVSFYDRSAFVVVRAGQRIGQLFPATDGRPGFDATGQVLPARAGAPCPLHFDDSVAVADDGTVTAAVEGQLQVRSNFLRVVQVLVIAESIDFSTGNVDFPGDVTVRHGIRDCFTVKCGGDLNVRELVEAATLDIGRDARLHSGMAARDKGSISVGRDLTAKYLDSVQCVVGRDMRIVKETQNCNAIVGRRFLGGDCAVIGGSLVVAGRAEVGQLGSQGGAATELVVGHIEHLESLACQALELVPALERTARSATERLGQLQRSAVKYTAAQIEEMNQLRAEAETAQASLAPLLGAIRRLAGSLDAHTEADLLIKRTIYPGVVIWIGGCRAEFETAVRGPVRIHLDTKGRPFIHDVAHGRAMALADVAKVAPVDRFLDRRALAAAAEKRAA